MNNVHIYAPKGYYVGQIRRYGHRKFEEVSRSNCPNKAMAKAVLKMTQDYKRARVLFITLNGYYEPVQMMELVK